MEHCGWDYDNDEYFTLKIVSFEDNELSYSFEEIKMKMKNYHVWVKSLCIAPRSGEYRYSTALHICNPL